MLPCATCAAGLKVEACRNEAFSCADSDFRGAGGPECGERTWIPNFSTVPHGFRTNLTDPACEEAASPVPPHNPTVKNDQDGPAGRTQPDASSPAAPAQRRKKRVANNLEWKDPASPIPAGLDATDLLVAEILGGWQSLPERCASAKRARSTSSSPLSHASTDFFEDPQATGSPTSSLSSSKKFSSSRTSVSPSGALAKASPHHLPAARRSSSAGIASSASPAERNEVPDWASRIVEHLKHGGQHLLHAICSHYRIDLEGMGEYSVEQIAHNAIFNPALPKAGRLPIMLKDIEGVDGWNMTFLRCPRGIYRSVKVSAVVKGQKLEAECRACSYCGSVFSGRFMKNAMHQRAGGWKEITDKTAAGNYSWASQIGKRLCVPCFTHFASQGTNVNANRLSIEQLVDSASQLAWAHDKLDAGGSSSLNTFPSKHPSSMSSTSSSSSSSSSFSFSSSLCSTPGRSSACETPPLRHGDGNARGGAGRQSVDGNARGGASGGRASGARKAVC